MFSWESLDRTLLRLRELLQLRAGTDEAATVETVRRNVDFKSANAWTLACTIVIACVGLDTNNMMAVFGAMLISPLMGPVVGVGLGLGIDDQTLVNRSVRNILYAVGIAIGVSTVYFLLSPLAIARSEILSFTRPTFFDVLVAIFGGATGVVALSRKTAGTSIAGVAMATVMMPPLCTVGFGLATFDPSLALSAFYLFLINAVFICLATLVVVRYLKFERIQERDPEVRQQVRQRITIGALILMAPSLVLAWRLQQETLFLRRAKEFVAQDTGFARSFVVDHQLFFDWAHPEIKLTFIGERLEPSHLEIMKARLQARGLRSTNLSVTETDSDATLARRMEEKISSQEAAARFRETQIAQLESKLGKIEGRLHLEDRIVRELTPIFPDLLRIHIPGDNNEASLQVFWRKAPGRQSREQFEEYLRRRANRGALDIRHNERPPST